MKKRVLASAVLVLLGAGCASSSPDPASGVNGQPAAQQQPVSAPILSEDVVYGPSYKANEIIVDVLRIGDVVSSPLTLTGKARGNWYFEAGFPVEIIDANNKLIANGVAKAQGDWMTVDFVPFQVELMFPTPLSGDMNATLVFRKDNPSGEPRNDDQMRFPVRIGKGGVKAE